MQLGFYLNTKLEIPPFTTSTAYIVCCVLEECDAEIKQTKKKYKRLAGVNATDVCIFSHAHSTYTNLYAHLYWKRAHRPIINHTQLKMIRSVSFGCLVLLYVGLLAYIASATTLHFDGLQILTDIYSHTRITLEQRLSALHA